jgi:hypothetical protein
MPILAQTTAFVAVCEVNITEPNIQTVPAADMANDGFYAASRVEATATFVSHGGANDTQR